jgi:predicted RNase H-like HicB family nuclease
MIRTQKDIMKKIHYTLYREDEDFVAQCMDYDVSSFGATEGEALANLREAVELYLYLDLN